MARPPSPATMARLIKIFEQLEEGVSLSECCRQKGAMSRSRVLAWVEQDQDVQDRYARARERGHDALADKLLRVADTPVQGSTVTIEKRADGTTTKTVNRDAVEHRRLQVDAYKWLLSKWSPKKYGEKLDIQHTVPVLLHTVDWANAPIERPPERDVPRGTG